MQLRIWTVTLFNFEKINVVAWEFVLKGPSYYLTLCITGLPETGGGAEGATASFRRTTTCSPGEVRPCSDLSGTVNISGLVSGHFEGPSEGTREDWLECAVCPLRLFDSS